MRSKLLHLMFGIGHYRHASSFRGLRWRLYLQLRLYHADSRRADRQRQHDGQRRLHRRLGDHRRENSRDFPGTAGWRHACECLHGSHSRPPVINLAELDQLSEILGNLTVADGTYTGANITISGNPGDVLLTVSADPEAGFAGTPGATIPSSQINIQGTTGSAGSLTVPVSVNFVSPLVVTAGSSNALDLEFDLAHPAFIVGHVPVTTGTTMWAVNFNGPVRHHPIADLTRLVLRHMYGSVTAVSTDNTSITITKEYPNRAAR